MNCLNCENGIIYVEVYDRVSREMALDSGIPELEGELINKHTESIPCPCCEGDYENCDRCRKSTYIQDIF